MLFLDKEIEYIKLHYNEILEEMKKQLNRSFGSVVNGQIDMICISFMNTSLYFGVPKFRISFFQKEDMWEHPLCEQEIAADWLFHEWKTGETEQELISQRKEVKAALVFASAIFKYALVRCDEFDNYQSLRRGEELCICFGEYKDWQFPIYMEQAKVDAFQNPNHESLEFRTFEQKVYKEKNFPDWELKQGKFISCRFTNCSFMKTNVTDVLFTQCTFDQVEFDQCMMYGVTFDACEFNNTTMKKCEFTYHKKQGEHLQGVYQNARFLNCNVDKISFDQSDISEVLIR